MNNKYALEQIINDVISSGRSIFLSLLICCFLYPCIILVLGHIIVPEKAEGSLIRNSSGVIIGSLLIGQKFTQSKYFWSRPSAVDYNASSSGGSNLSTTNLALRLRIKNSVSALKNQSDRPVPLDLVTASGSGLDPNITIQGAYYQAERVAKARRVNVKIINDLILQSSSKESLFKPSLVNVLELNLLLNRTIQSKE
jgi:potassium-transporting ATPase KdpC subunit